MHRTVTRPHAAGHAQRPRWLGLALGLTGFPSAPTLADCCQFSDQLVMSAVISVSSVGSVRPMRTCQRSISIGPGLLRANWYTRLGS